MRTAALATYDDALREAKILKEILNGLGVAVSIELQAGRLDQWYVKKYLVMNHHTATHFPNDPGDSLTPALYICKVGRSDVPGPLCNGYGGYDFVFRIITMGLANHPGQGGPVTVDGVYIPEDSARAPTFGIEWEGGYESWPKEHRKWMATVNLGVTRYMHRSTASQLEHKNWAPYRKVDRVDMTREDSIAETNAVADPQEWDEMATKEEIQAVVHEEVQPVPLITFGIILDQLNDPSSPLSQAVVSRAASGCNKAHLDENSRTDQRLNALADDVVARLNPPDPA